MDADFWYCLDFISDQVIYIGVFPDTFKVCHVLNGIKAGFDVRCTTAPTSCCNVHDNVRI